WSGICLGICQMEAQMNEHNPPGPSRIVSLFRNGRNQAIRIPVEFELPGTQATIRRDGDRLIIEPHAARRPTMREFLDSLDPFPSFPDVDDSDLPPLRDVKL